MSWWNVWRNELHRVNEHETDLAEKDLAERKERGKAVHAEATHIVERNNLAEKFHAAMQARKL